MSARKTVEIVCDVCNDTAEDDWSLTARHARQLAQASGWHVGRSKGAQDICPDCWEEGHR